MGRFDLYGKYIKHRYYTGIQYRLVCEHYIVCITFFFFLFFFFNNMHLGYQGSTKDPCFTKIRLHAQGQTCNLYNKNHYTQRNRINILILDILYNLM
jgi:hypothetical protein